MSFHAPQHIAIIMDGNGRWAKKRYLPRIAGHKQGLESLKLCIQHCLQRQIKILTVFAFSSENWQRPPEEVSGLFDLLAKALSHESVELNKQGIRLHFVGDFNNLNPDLRSRLHQVEHLSANNNKLVLNVCFSYGGRWDIAQAAAKVQAKALPMTPANIEQHLALSHVPDPDLLIRTGGEYRISNFLLWQAAYSEWYFTGTLWPDFDETDLDVALKHYAQRERRFGKISEQLDQEEVYF